MTTLDLSRARPATLVKWEWLRRALAERDRSECWDDGPFSFGPYRHEKYAYCGGLQVAHVALELDGKQRPPAPGNWALHSCDNPPCVNPDHLRWGTAKDNSQDMKARGRTRAPCAPKAHPVYEYSAFHQAAFRTRMLDVCGQWDRGLSVKELTRGPIFGWSAVECLLRETNRLPPTKKTTLLVEDDGVWAHLATRALRLSSS